MTTPPFLSHPDCLKDTVACRGSAPSDKTLNPGSKPLMIAGVAELVDARDLKSLVPKGRTGSIPVARTIGLEPEPAERYRSHTTVCT